jgi:hypothetical protein
MRPYLWSDDEGFVYMNEAQNQFCRMTQGVSDATTPEVVTVPVITGELFSPTHESILSFRQATLDSTGYNLDIKNNTEIKRWDNTVGTVSQMIIGLENHKVRWNYTPALDDSVTLLVYRLPLTSITDFDQELEIEAKHHASLTYWMSHLAYLKPDTETFDKQASDRALTNFERYCFQVTNEQDRYKHRPQPVAYGGI